MSNDPYMTGYFDAVTGCSAVLSRDDLAVVDARVKFLQRAVRVRVARRCGASVDFVHRIIEPPPDDAA